MARIRVLPESLTNRIAAGEVVERPASVVKELLENALDAGASRVSVEIGRGGRSLIRVCDDGHGMEHDDALLCLERYATSKIATDEDLFSIRTLGFRGEALPSIASVCRMTLVTRTPEADCATKIRLEGGVIRDVSVEGAPPGTLVEVADLFYNTPARRKFLKSVTTEMAHVADTAAAMAMGWPSVAFELSHNGRTLFLWPRAENPADRVREVLGADLAEGLVPLSLAAPHVSATGFLALPDVSRSTGRGLFVFVNHRLVRDRLATHAVSQGYGPRLMKGRRPVAAVFLTVPADEVDVNVHPTKAEVRFAYSSLVHDALAQAVDRALSGASRGSFAPQDRLARQARQEEEKIPVSWGAAPRPAARAPETAPPARSPVLAFPVPETRPAAEVPPAPRAPLSPRPGLRVEEVLLANPAPAPRPEPSSAPRGQAALAFPDLAGEDAGFSVVGRLPPCYIVCQCRGGLLLVDQHAAHERILFERFSGPGDVRPESQALLLPEAVELSHAEASALTPLLPGLSRAGLEVERFSGRAFVVKAVPALLSGCGLAALVRGIAEEAQAVGSSGALERALSAAFAHLACRGAIKAGERLSLLEMERLVRDLVGCEHPGQCPHGRPTWLWWTSADLEKAFGRKG